MSRSLCMWCGLGRRDFSFIATFSIIICRFFKRWARIYRRTFTRAGIHCFNENKPYGSLAWACLARDGACAVVCGMPNRSKTLHIIRGRGFAGHDNDARDRSTLFRKPWGWAADVLLRHFSQHPVTGCRSFVADEICDPLARVTANRVVRRLADLEMARDDRAPFTFYVHFHGRGFLLQYVSFSLAVEGAPDAPSILSGDGDHCCALPSVVCRPAVEAYARILVHFACFDRRCRNRVDRQSWIAVYE